MFFFYISSEPFPHPPVPKPTYNGSCPYAHNMTDLDLQIQTSADDVVFAAYEVGSNNVKFCWPVFAHAVRDSAPYLLEVDDWFTGRTTFKTAYAGSNNEYTLSNLLPGQRLRVRLKVYSHLLPNKENIRVSATNSLQLSNTSYCGNLHDMSILRNASKNDMPAKLQNCAFATNMITCIEQNLGFSIGCSKCFAAENSCIIAQCVDKNKFVCLTKPKGAACKKCINEHCMAPTAQCAGIPLWALNITSAPLTPS